MNSYVDWALTRAESEAEQLLAYLRVLACVVIIAVFWAAGALDQDHMAMFSVTALVAVTAASLALSLSGFFRPWLPWAFATLDVAVLLHCLTVMALAMGYPFSAVLAAPGASLIFLFLAIAAVRHRPLLVLYTGTLFVAGWLVLWATLGSSEPQISVPADWGFAGEAARLSVIALTAVVLFVAVIRSRRKLTASAEEARLRGNLARYFSPAIAGALAQAGPGARSFRSHKAAVMFVDIRGFTTTTEHMASDELADFLNEYRRRVCAPITQHEGMVDKFIGDGVMAVFGVPHPGAADARNALQCAFAILDAVDHWNEERTAARLPAVDIGMGVHYGDVTAGALGDEQRLEFTVIGDTVNAANRIEELAGDLRARLVVSASAFRAAGLSDAPEAWDALPHHPLRGRRTPMDLMRWRGARSALGEVDQEAEPSVGKLAAGVPQDGAPQRRLGPVTREKRGRALAS